MEEEAKKSSGIVIQEDDFILEQVDDASPFWDLKLKRTIKGRNGVTREEFKIEGYGMPMTHAMLHIINFRVAKRNNGKVLQMKEYMRDYQDVSKELFKILKVK